MTKRLYDPELERIVQGAISRIISESQEHSPELSDRMSVWMRGLGGGSTALEYFTDPSSFPMFLLPWWLEKSLRSRPDPSFQEDLAVSTVSGYLYLRMVDNLMDGHESGERGLLPALGVFHTQFQRTYQRYFPDQHPFWEGFVREWFASAESSLQDSFRREIDRSGFVRVSARKTSGSKIPVAAVCYRYSRPDLVRPWSDFLEVFGRWHQMWNDLFDWPRDLEAGTVTYFLSEAARRCSRESVAEWVAREGWTWGRKTLDEWMSEARALAEELECPALLEYLTLRQELVRGQGETIRDGLESAGRLAKVLRIEA